MSDTTDEYKTDDFKTIDPKSFGLSRDPYGKLVLIDSEGSRHTGVEPIRAFPFSDPTRGISICDAEGRELTWIEDIEALPTTTRETLEREMDSGEFMPTILRIVRAPLEAMPADWEVVTDRGQTRFTLNSEDDIRRLGRRRAVIVDAQGIRYLIPDTQALDAPSRRALERYFF